MICSPETTHVGWIGTGVMGQAMCQHLLNAGYQVTVTTRTPAKAASLVERGAAWADSPAAVAAAAHVTFAIVGYPHDVRQVFLGDQGAVAAAAPGSILVDMTTSQPTLAEEIFSAASARGVHALDAPVSGGDVGAREARLSIMIGGGAEIAQQLAPVWELLGTRWVHQGPAGAGQHTKMVNQTLIASGMVAVCEGLLYAYRAGLDLQAVLQSVASGAAGSWSLTNYGPRMLAGDFAPGFFVEHFIKDMGIALEEARRMQLALPGLALAQQLYIALAAAGHGKSGTHALIHALARLSQVDWNPPEATPGSNRAER